MRAISVAKERKSRTLDLGSQNLEIVPPEICELTELTELFLHYNKIQELPPELARLENLRELRLDDNPLISPPAEIRAQGSQAILSFLKGREQSTVRQWVSKLLVVGEGGVGKTQLLRHLRGEHLDPDIPTTHGVEIHTCLVQHPSEEDVVMELNAWDFGGQQIYHATHQFFLTNRSLFLVVWNARLGYEQGRLYYWLNTIQALAPESPVLLVATHCDERDADLPLADMQKNYPRLAGQIAISNSDGTGVDHLKTRFATLASRLPLMGEAWPAAWLKTAEEIRNSEDKYTSPSNLKLLMEEQGVSAESHNVLTRWLHELGDLLYFEDDSELADLVILKPQWVAEYIGRVLVT